MTISQLWVATRKGLFLLEQRGREARVVRVAFEGVPVTMLLPDPRDGAVYAAVGHGHFGAKLHRSKDGGETFDEISAPKYPEKPADLDERDPMRGTPIPWSLEQIWSLEPGGDREPGVLWCGTIPGGLFRSEDGGDSWQLIESLWRDPSRKEWFGGGYDYPGIHSISVDPRDARRASIAISCGGVWVTEDAGATWACRTEGMHATYMPPERSRDPAIQDPHRMVRCPAAPDTLWVQHHNGVFRSTNGGASWTEIESVTPSRFGFAVAVHPQDPELAWLVPLDSDERRMPVAGRVVVARTRDGGKSFTELSAGLPQTHAYDVVYRHCLDVDRSGNRLAMGSTTGSVFITDDQGDHWTVAMHHLPPVYALRYA